MRSNPFRALRRAPRLVAALALAAAALPALAQVTVKDAWVRGMVAQQKATGAFMQVTSAQPARLVSISSPAAGVVEIHEMTMDKGVMKMRAVQALELPAGKTVDLKPGGYHVMMMDLKQPLKDGDTVPFTMVIEGADKTKSQVEVMAVVKALTAPARPDHTKH